MAAYTSEASNVLGITCASNVSNVSNVESNEEHHPAREGHIEVSHDSCV